MSFQKMRFDGHIQLTLKAGEAPSHVPNHLDHLLGACRPAGRLDGGQVDRALNSIGGGFRTLGVYTSRRNLGRVGEHHCGFGDLEEQLGLSRTYKVQIADAAQDQRVVDRLRELPNVETAVVQRLATAPLAGAQPLVGEAEAAVKLNRADAWRPHERIRAAEALEIEPGAESVAIGVVDTGVSPGHPEFQRRLLAGYDTVNLGMGAANDQVTLVGDSRGLDFNPSDDVNHGSHVAGIIGAQAKNLEDAAYRQQIAAALGDAILKSLSSSSFSLQSLPFDYENGHSDSSHLQPPDYYALGGAPKFEIKESVGEGGANKPNDVFAVKQRLIELGFDWITLDKKMDAETIHATRLFQSIVNDSKTLSGDGKIDVGKNTYKWLQAVNAPRWRKMPKGSAGEGFVNFEYDDENIHIYGTDWLADTLAGAGIHYRDKYLKSHPAAALLTVNDASLARGGKAPPHGEHQTGMDCDLRLPRTDGKTGGINIGKSAELLLFDRNAARAILQALKAQPLVSRLLFNDQTLVDEGLCKKSTPDHNHHIHVDISPPARGAVELNDLKHYRSGGRLYQGSHQDDIDYQTRALEVSCSHTAISANLKGNFVEYKQMPVASDRKNPKENVFLLWNNIPANTCKIDVVVHFHGFNTVDKKIIGTKPFFDYLAETSGLNFSDPTQKSSDVRVGPTLCILPFGHKYEGYKYSFPFFTGNSGGLQKLIDFGLESLAKHYRLSPNPFTKGRLILTAHSGGGLQLAKVINHNADAVDEVHLFDATYPGEVVKGKGVSDLWIEWVKKKIAADSTSKLVQSQMAKQGGAFRVLYGMCGEDQWKYKQNSKNEWYCSTSETDTEAQRINIELNNLIKAGSHLRNWYRVEQTGVNHFSIPKTFGFQLLSDAGKDLTVWDSKSKKLVIEPVKPSGKATCCPGFPKKCVCRGKPPEKKAKV